MDYYIGVDGGGTKTAVCAAAADASVLLSGQTGSSSWREYGIEHVIKNIGDVIGALPFAAGGGIAGIVMGLPCFGESKDGDIELKKAVFNAFPGVPVYLTNDVEVGWAGSLGLSPGINVVSGTGSIAFGRDEAGKTARCGGWSEFYGDEGSCYWIGRKVLQVFSKQADGRIPKDELYDIIYKKWDLKNDFDAIDLIHNEYMTNRDKVAALQLIAKEAALAGSLSAKSLYKEAADELCGLVTAIRDILQFDLHPFPVSYSGGLFKSGELILPHFLAGIEAAGGKPVTPLFEPVYGALLLSFEKNHPESLQKLQERLSGSVSQ